MTSERLDPLNLPLHGSRLIEASAGTGKTWTIAALFLRLVLGQAPGGPARPLVPGRILVMTFTRAATRELAGRIRERLLQAAACFAGDAVPAADDAFLAGLLAQHPAGPDRRTAAWRLAMAAESMDDAAITTIDAWCQRMLREHAFDSGFRFDEVLQTDAAAMLETAAQDYWRQQVYPLADPELAVALRLWPDVEGLIGSVGRLVELPLPAGSGQGLLAECIDAARTHRAQALAALKSGWPERTDRMLGWLQAQWSLRECPLDKRALGPAHATRWIEALKAWATDPDAAVLDLGKGAERLTRSGVQGAIKAGHSLELPGEFEDFERLLAGLRRLPETGPALRLHAASHIAARLQALKDQSASFDFADLHQRLHAALDEAVHGEKAQRLRRRIVEQFPVALVDEFQDTSPAQLGIFDRLYRIEADDPALGLLLIGDPKQSIYAFRGADIYSYLGTRRATRGRHHMLGTNYRSTRALVEALNHLFGAAESRDGEGAFMFRPAAPGGVPAAAAGSEAADAGLPFVPVDAQGRPERCVTSSGELPALTMCLEAGLRGIGDSRKQFAALCAERVVGLLDDPGAGFVRAGEPFQRLRPADIAVLVRTGTEAAAMRLALAACGVASVYLSDKDSVFASAEAAGLLRLLQAAASPRDARLARAALATPLLGLALDELVALAVDEARFDSRCELLRELNATWQAQGVLAMLRRALHGFELPARWLAEADGERRLTNLLHLAELLQQASAQLEGEQALIRWLARQIDDAAGRPGGDEQVLRLESDADRVRIVTVHKAKGLEYPLVFLPFAAHYRGVERRNTSLLYEPDGQGRRSLSLSPDDAQLAAADKERQREDLRLLYVATTRARHGLWLGLAAIRFGRGGACGWHASAIGYLISGPHPRTPEQIAQDVLVWAADGAVDIVVDIVAEAPPPAAGGGPHPPTRRPSREPLPALVPAVAYAAAFDRQWSISSYSALVRDVAPAARADASAPRVLLRDDDDRAEDGPEPADPREPADPSWHAFPRGALAGNFLHGLLEWLAGEGFALAGSAGLALGLARRCERQGWGHRTEVVTEWLGRVCATPLPALGVPLSGLDAVLPEMEFWFPSDGLRAAAVDALCRRHLLPGRPRPALPERVLHGMLMGFMDLVYAQAGRYGVLDYKSNFLGPRDADYTPAAMASAMLEHRYDVQAALYLLALHRLLRVRLGPRYRPAEHLHGAVYMFIRGVRGPAAGCLHLAAPVELIEALDAMLVPGTAATPGQGE